MSFTYEITLPEKLEYNGVPLDLMALDTDELNRVVGYTLAYGYGKSLQDSVAGVAKALRAEGKDETAIKARVQADMAERRDAIVAGTIGVRGPRLTGPDVIRRQVIEEYFKSFLAAKNKKLPRAGKDATEQEKKAVAEKIAAFKAKYAELDAARIDEEVQRRIAAQSESAEEEIDLDLDDLTA